MPLSLSTSTRALAAVLAAAFALAGAPRAARAGEGAEDPDLSYVWDGGALPFFWGPYAADLALRRWVAPPENPRLFSADEGGAEKASWQLPGWTLRAGIVAVGGTIALAGDDSKWDHVKGLAESIATAGLVTNVLKLSFGRHRPDYTPEAAEDGARKSFPSGHATSVFVLATYSALYLHEHVFDRGRAPGRIATPLEALTYLGIAGGATALSLERVIHNRHYGTDVLAGAAIGATASTAFFYYQEHRFHHREQSAQARTLGPGLAGGAAVIQLGGVF